MNYDNPDTIWEGITPCPNHTHMMNGCEHCSAEMTARGARVDQMSSEAAKIAASLGGPPPPQVILDARLDVLLDSIMRDPKDRMRYEGEVGRRLMNVLKDVQLQMKQPTLHGVDGRPLRSV